METKKADPPDWNVSISCLTPRAWSPRAEATPDERSPAGLCELHTHAAPVFPSPHGDPSPPPALQPPRPPH